LNTNERLQKFLSDIDQYIESKNFTGQEFNEEFKIAEKLTLESLENLSQDDCFNYSYMLYQYADLIALELSKSKSVVNWCENALNQLVSKEIIEMPQYTKYELKFASILNENDVAKKINEWKLTAQGRSDYLYNKEHNIRKKAECLMEKGKRK